jgi:hypothetical protein
LLQDLAPEPAYDASTFCDEYDDDLQKSNALAVAMIVFTLLINISLKGISRGLSAAERPHSFTELEKSVCRKMSYSLMINMVALPLALTADVSKLSKLPFVFDGSHRDTDRRWYQGYTNKFSQLALTNAIVFPITSYVPVFKWGMKLLFTRNYAKTQYQLNSIYAPPQYDLAQRAACFRGVLDVLPAVQLRRAVGVPVPVFHVRRVSDPRPRRAESLHGDAAALPRQNLRVRDSQRARRRRRALRDRRVRFRNQGFTVVRVRRRRDGRRGRITALWSWRIHKGTWTRV